MKTKYYKFKGEFLNPLEENQEKKINQEYKHIKVEEKLKFEIMQHETCILDAWWKTVEELYENKIKVKEIKYYKAMEKTIE